MSSPEHVECEQVEESNSKIHNGMLLLAKAYHITCLEARAIIIRMVAGPTVHFMLTIVMLSLSMLVSSADKMKDMQIIKREIFLQKLAAKIDHHTG